MVDTTHADDIRKLTPLIHSTNPELGGHLDPRFKAVTVTRPAKILHNDKNGSDMDLQNFYTKGPLKWENTGKTCSNCMAYYPDHNLASGMGRCKARGLMRVHQDTPAEDQPRGWTDPISGYSFSQWPGCPEYRSKETLSLH